jgi:hypothetical protein
VNRVYRTLSETGEGEGFAAVRRSALRFARSWSDLHAANRYRRRPFEYNLRSFPPTLQYRFGSRPLVFQGNEETVCVGVNR